MLDKGLQSNVFMHKIHFSLNYLDTNKFHLNIHRIKDTRTCNWKHTLRQQIFHHLQQDDWQVFDLGTTSWLESKKHRKYSRII